MIFTNIIAVILVFTIIGMMLSGALWATGAFSNKYWQAVPGKQGFQITSLAAIVTTIVYLFVTLVSFLISPAPPKASYAVYQSHTDIPGFTMKTTWDTPTIQNESIFLSCSILPDKAQQIQQLFGSNYDFFLIAQLGASAFTIDLKEQAQQSITQKTISFNWTMTPTLTGKQAININIIGIWIQQQGGKQITRYLGNHSWHVNIDSEPTPFLTAGQVNISTLVTSFLTAIISVPLWEIIQKRSNAKKEKGKVSGQQQTST